MNNHEKLIKLIARPPEQYSNFEMESVSVEEVLENKTIQDFWNLFVVFDDMSDFNQHLINPCLLGEDILI